MKTFTKYELKEINWPGKTFIGKRSIEAFDNLSTFFTEQYRGIDKELQKQNILPAGPPCAIYYKIDEEMTETDIAAVFPVGNQNIELNGFQKIQIPPSKVLTTTYIGPYEGLAAAYQEMENYIKQKGYHRDFIIEEYLSDPMAEPDSSKWMTNIYFILNKKS